MTTNRRASTVDVCRSPARVLAEQIRRRQVTSVEALEENLAKIAAHNPAVNAVVSLDAERARRWAESADAALDHGDVWGPLHGVPLALKDGHDVAGLRTTMGAPPLDRVAHADGAVAARLRGAGANIIGHTNVAAWLADPLQTENPIFGRTANPWDPGRTPGGSSGGAAAAVASGMTSFDIGSDLAGSIRLPAHFCGLYGLKPTEHRVPLTGFFRDPADGPRPIRIMACLGPIARDLDDLDLALRVISGPDGKDSDVAPVPIGPPEERRLTEVRFAVASTPPGASISAITRQMVERVAAGASDAGAMVEERLPEIDWGEMHELFGDLVGAVTGVFSPDAGLRDEQRTLGWYLAALERRDRIGAIWEAWFEDLDCLVLPVAAASAFRHCEQGADIDVEGTTVSYWAFGGPLPASNLTGMPALVVPAGLDETGLPIGVQLVGPRWSEMRLIGIARQLEKAGVLPGFRFPPGY